MCRFWDRARHRESGAVAAEFVIILPLFLIVTFGIFSLGAGWFRQQTVTTAAREGARVGATYPSGDPAGGAITQDWFDFVFAATDQASLGQWDYICIAYVGDPAKLGESGALAAKEEHGDLSYSAGTSACYDDGRAPEERRVQVAVVRQEPFTSFFFGTRLDLAGTASTRYETPYPRD